METTAAQHTRSPSLTLPAHLQLLPAEPVSNGHAAPEEEVTAEPEHAAESEAEEAEDESQPLPTSASDGSMGDVEDTCDVEETSDPDHAGDADDDTSEADDTGAADDAAGAGNAGESAAAREAEHTGEPEDEAGGLDATGSMPLLPQTLVCDSTFMLPREPVLVRLKGPFEGPPLPRPDTRECGTGALLGGHPLSTLHQLLELVHAWVVQHRHGHIDWAAVGAQVRPHRLCGDEAHRLWRGLAYGASGARAGRAPPAALGAPAMDGDSDLDEFVACREGPAL